MFVGVCPVWGLVESGGQGPLLTNPAMLGMGDSITNAAGAQSIADMTNFHLRGRLVPIVGYNQGVSGNKTADMIARDSSALALLSAYSGDKLYMILAGTNDIVVGGLPASTIQANLQTLINNGKAVATMVCIRTILKRADASFTGNPAFEVTRNAVNNWIRAISDPQVIVIDYDLSPFNPTSGVHTNDGLHPNNLGAWVLGKYTAEKLAPYIAPVDVLANKTGNLMPNNGDMSGTGGGQSGSTGQVATGWQVRQFISGISGVNSKGTLDGAPAQVMYLNGTASANGFCQLRATINYSGLAGEVYECLARVKVTGTSNFSNLSVTCDGTIGFGGGTVTFPLNQYFDGVVRLGRLALSADDSQNIVDMNFSVLAGAVLGLEAKVSEPIWRKVS